MRSIEERPNSAIDNVRFRLSEPHDVVSWACTNETIGQSRIEIEPSFS